MKISELKNFNNIKLKNLFIEVITPNLNCTNQRIFILFLFFIFFSLSIAYKLQNLILNNTHDIQIKNYTSTVSSFKRANIVDRNGQLLAVDLSTSSVYANPRILLDSKEAAFKLSEIFPDLKYPHLLNEFKSNKRFVWIKRNITPKEKYAVNSLGLPGIFFEEGHKRIYPYGNLLSHIIGYVGIDGMGLGGLEKHFDQNLIIDPDESLLKPDLKLSIDLKMQYVVHEELSRAMEEFKPIGAAAIVTDVSSGEILAMVSLPDFDPHHPGTAKSEQLFNRASLASQELGSVFKAVTFAMALESKVISLNDAYDVSEPIKVARFTLKDYRGKGGIQTIPEIFINSSNIGTAKVSLDLGTNLQKKYLSQFGLFDELKLEIPEIGSPIFPSQSRWSNLSTMTISYGHGMMLTPLHMIRAFNGIVNKGQMHDLTLVKDHITQVTTITNKYTSEQMRRLLRLNITNGSGKKARAEGYLVGGKTGSAEKSQKGGYNRKENLSSFIATFPVDNPKYSIFVLLDVPKGNKSTFGFSTGGWTAAPVVGNIINRIAHIAGIEPVNENDEQIIKKFKLENYNPPKNDSF